MWSDRQLVAPLYFVIEIRKRTAAMIPGHKIYLLFVIIKHENTVDMIRNLLNCVYQIFNYSNYNLIIPNTLYKLNSKF